MLRMYMSEKMQPGLDCCYAAEKFFRTVMDIVVKVEDAERRCVGDENIRVFRNICIMLGLAVRDAVAHEHWDTIEFHTVNFHSGIAQVMDITVKPVNGGTVKTVIVVAANEYLLRTRKVAEPVHEIQRFRATVCDSHACLKYAIFSSRMFSLPTKIKDYWLNLRYKQKRFHCCI